MYTVGNELKISLFGKSHGECIGCIIEGLPLGMAVDEIEIGRMMDRRRPSDRIGTPRKEEDKVVFESGLTGGKVSSRYVMLNIQNKDADPSSYEGMGRTPRPGHADLPAMMRYRSIDMSGGAQFSGRMTAPLVAAGAIALQYLKNKGIGISAYTRRIGSVSDDNDRDIRSLKDSEHLRTHAADDHYDRLMTEEIISASNDGDSVGGDVRCIVSGLPIGFGGIWFDALDVSIARMMFSIPGVKGVEFGKGFGLTSMHGSESNDQYTVKNGRITAMSNSLGGVCGGMSNGMPLVFDVAFKPTPSISKEQNTVDLGTLSDVSLKIEGRHDPCIVPRAVCVVEAMAALTVMDQELSFGPKL